MAVFSTNYYPGKLEAVSYYRGAEQSHAELETVTQPKAVKLECAKKSLEPGEYTYIDIYIADRDGRRVRSVIRSVEVEISGDARLIALGNTDPTNINPLSSTTCSAFEGHATAIVQGLGEGKAVIKVTSEGLLSNKVTLKIK
jgi:beta-galactosidase